MTPLKFKSYHFNFTSLILLGLTFIQLGVSIWAINRGFDFSDEAYSYLGFQSPEEVNHVVTYYTLLITNFFGWISPEIANIRILKLTIQIVSSLIFSVGLSRQIKSYPKLAEANASYLHLISIIGTLLYNARGSQMLTYDLLSVSLLQIGAGLLFFITKNGQGEKRTITLTQYIMMGAVLFAMFMVKFSNAILFAAALSIFMLWNLRFKEVTIFCCFNIIGFLLFGLLIFKQNFFKWLKAYFITLTNSSDSSLGSIIDKYQWDLNDLSGNLYLDNIFLFSLFILLITVALIASKRIIKISTLFGSFVLFIYFSVANKFYLGGIAHRYTYSLMYVFVISILIISFVIFYVYQRKKGVHFKSNISVLLIFLFLLSAPFIGSIGTNNYLRMNIILYMSFWFTFIYLLAFWMDKWLALMLILIICANATFQGIYGLVYSPYRLYTSLIYQVTPLPETINSDRIKLDDGKIKEVKRVYELVHSQTNFSPGMPIFSYRSEYGFIYLLKGTLPGWCWYREDAFQKSYCDCLTNSKIKDFEKMIFIIPKDHQLDSAFVSTLNSLNVRYPEHYKQIGDVESYFDGSIRNLIILAPENILNKKLPGSN